MKLPRRALVLGGAASLVARRAGAEPALVTLGRFATSYAFDAEHKARASNVQLAAEAIDGKKVPAGGTFSFNDAVGERTAAFGYAKALVLRDGMLAEGAGGGACQVASTLHAAALLAGLDVALRVPHSRPSAYVRMALDATVAYPKIDLKIANSTADEVGIVARAANGNIEIRIQGITRRDVTLTTEVLDRTAIPRTFEPDPKVGPDEARRTAFGIPGYRVRRVRTLVQDDGTPRHDVRIDTYAAVPEVLRVAPGFDHARLAPPEDEEHAAMAKVTVTTAPTALRPAAAQLKPSTLVTLDNRT
ncbi:MAG: VanW family protein [Labilithrix sp.]|nr:VanW family protein [Labilithrix sp.]MCW5815012.1 VanW family protein [Labilithrix sp.]